ncbi:hypothetical protein D1007_59717 [Hordeum vulgare]|nr:hypothetical protein D1007_59717 [Hordeum vulgare]
MSIGPPPQGKFTRQNYLMWKAMALPQIKGAHMDHHLDLASQAPPETLTIVKDGKEEQIANFARVFWGYNQNRCWTQADTCDNNGSLSTRSEVAADETDERSQEDLSALHASGVGVADSPTNSGSASQTNSSLCELQTGLAVDRAASLEPGASIGSGGWILCDTKLY